MTEQELLHAISSIIQGQIEPLRDGISSLKGDMLSLKGDMASVKGDMTFLKNDISSLKANAKSLKEEVKFLKEEVNLLEIRMESLETEIRSLDGKADSLDHGVKSIAITLENGIIPRLQTIESCYTDTYKRYHTSVEEINAMQDDIKLLKIVVTDHSEKLLRIT